MPHAQISLETLTSILIVFIFFIVSMGLLAEINSNAQFLKEQSSQWNECTKIARLIEEVFVQGPGTQVKAQFSYPFIVSSRSVYMNDPNGVTCDFTGMAAPASVSAGTVRFSDTNGWVVVRNA